MNTKIFLAHSAGAQSCSGEGSVDLANYLRHTLNDYGEIVFPIVEDPDRPAYQHWKLLFDTEFEKMTEPIVLVGHSLGGSVLLKYLSEEKTNLKIRGMFLIATPQWSTDGWDVEEFALHKHATDTLNPVGKLYFYHCLSDPIVPFEHLNFYKKIFPDAIFRALPCDDHIFSNGLKELAEDIHSILSAGDKH